MIHNLIINASPLIVLGKAGLMKLISPLAKSWVIPESVIEEVSQKSSVDVILAQLSECSEVSCQKVSVINPLVAGWNLGKGESDVIALALDYSGYGVVLDDLQARKCAQIFDLPLTGTVGLLVKAKKEKLIDCVKPAFEKLVESGLYLDPQLIKRILASVGEQIKAFSADGFYICFRIAAPELIQELCSYLRNRSVSGISDRLHSESKGLMNALIFGADGQDGYYISELCKAKGINPIGISRTGGMRKNRGCNAVPNVLYSVRRQDLRQRTN